MLIDSHMHTPLCGHATGWPVEYAASAEEVGIGGIVMTCHSPATEISWQDPGVRMTMEQYEREYPQLVATARLQFQGRVEVRMGLECDYVPGWEDSIDDLLNGAGRPRLDYILGSVHPHLRPYRERFFTGDVAAYQRTYFDHLALAAESGLFHCLAHPDLIKNSFADQWSFDAIRPTILQALDRIAKTGIAMEFNTSGRLKTIAEVFPSCAMLREMAQRKIPIVLGSDAHQPVRVGDHFAEALAILSEAGYHQVIHFVGGNPLATEFANISSDR